MLYWNWIKHRISYPYVVFSGGIYIMSYLSLSEIKLGMILNQGFISPNGNIAFGQGTVVNEYIRSCLREWEVKGADVSEGVAVEFNVVEFNKLISDFTIGLADNMLIEKTFYNTCKL